MMIRTFLLSLLLAFPAFAQEAASAPSPLTGIMPIVLIIVIFYFLIIRPQNKKYKEHRAMIEAIKRGDKIITGGGIHGKVLKVEEGGKLKVEIAQGVEITVEQPTVSQVPSKPEPVEKADKPSEEVKKTAKKAANDNG